MSTNQEDVVLTLETHGGITLCLANFPMPPSINSQLIPSRGRFIKSKEARSYDKSVDLFILKNRVRLENARKVLSEKMVEQKKILKVDCYFVFPDEKIYSSKNRKILAMDANNRLKSSLDGLVKCIGIDDKFIFSGNCEKISSKGVTEGCVIMMVTLRKPRNLSDLLQEFALESGKKQLQRLTASSAEH